MEPIPTTVEQFLRANIDSIDQLEILRIVVGDPSKEHGALSLAHELQISLDLMERHVKALSSRGLLTIIAAQPLTCRHGLQPADLAGQVQQLYQFYLQRPVTLIKMVYDKPPSQLKSFADAFRLKKEK